MSKIRETENRTIRLKMIDGTKINGQVNIKSGKGHDRLSDLVRETANAFLVVYKAQIYEQDLEHPVKVPTVFVNKDHILWATPDDTQK